MDYAGAVTAIRENGAASGAGVLATFVYDSRGRRESLTRGNGVVTNYGYDNVSRLETLTQNLAGTSHDQTLTFGYNPASQITSRTSTNGAYAWSGLYTVDRAYAINGLNQITTAPQTFNHDGRGNLTFDGTTTYGYDAENRLISTNGGSFTYDPLGRLYQTATSAVPSTVTRFSYDGADVVGEHDGSNALLRRYVHGPGVDEPLVRYDVATGARRWLVADHQGSIVALTDSGGSAVTINTYDEYGVPNLTNDGLFQYTGQMWSASMGLYHYKARAYSPTLGRFLQTDPIGYGAGTNLYAYVDDDPVNATDPSGLEPVATPVDELVVAGTRIPRATPIDGISFTGGWEAHFAQVSGRKAEEREPPPTKCAPGRLNGWQKAGAVALGLGDTITLGVYSKIYTSLPGSVGEASRQEVGSTPYNVAFWGSSAISGLRLAYAGTASSLSNLSGQAAVAARNSLKSTFRMGLFPNARMYTYEQMLAKYGSDAAVAQAAARTNKKLNAGAGLGAASATSGGACK